MPGMMRRFEFGLNETVEGLTEQITIDFHMTHIEGY